MQRNFILTDVMKTGNHQELESYISMHSMEGQSFDMTGEYYTLHDYNLDSYDRRFAIIDTRSANDRLKDNTEFMAELHRRVDQKSRICFHKSKPMGVIRKHYETSRIYVAKY